MNKKRLYIALWVIICLAIWFFIWQEYTKYQIRKAFQEAFSFDSEIENIETNKSNEKADNNTSNKIKDKEKSDKKVKDNSITLKKWVTETVAWKYSNETVEAEISVSDIAFVEEIRPPEPKQSLYTYYPAKEWKTYAVIYLKMKNTWGESFNADNVIRNPYSFTDDCSSEAIFGWKYKYTADIVAKLEKDNNWWYSYDSYFYIDPLETQDIIVAFSVPNEVKDMDAYLSICLWNQKIIIDANEVTPEPEVNSEATEEE